MSISGIMTLEDLGKEIRQRRKEAGLTQTDLAAAVGITRHSLSALEKGDRGLSAPILLKAIAELGGSLRLEWK